MEEWRPIPGLAGFEASSLGRIRKLRYKILSRELGTRRQDYPRVSVSLQSNKRVRHLVHVLVARAFIGECPKGYEHNHKDGNKSNARPENLEFMTHSQNEHHKFDVLKYAVNQGQRHGMAKLSDTEAVEIRSLYAQGLRQADIARMFSLSPSSISMLLSGKTWRHLTNPER